ncbi:MAG TPA: HAD family phosphatase [Tepidisphaeraceae bacterium]|nr:HAD family phosphatase [Tepidisphaeraceae bacterium]
MPNGLGLIFDMDGVLVNSYQAHLQSWRQMASQHGLSVSDSDFARTFGRTTRDIIGVLWPGRFDAAQVAQFDLEKEAAYRRVIEADFPEMDGAGDLIAALHKAGFKLAIGSSGPPENVAVVRKCVPHGELIDATVNGGEVKHGKPDPEVFVLCGQKIGIEPKRCAVIEDAVAGVDAARRAGMISIGLLGTATREALAVHAHKIVDSLRQLTPANIADLIQGTVQG